MEEIKKYSNLKCYANFLGNCSKEISKEHYISRSILKQLAKNGTAQVANVSSIPSTKNNFQIFGIDSIASKILCQKHNSDLSGLDNKAAYLFEKINSFDKDKQGGSKVCINGARIERWILKLAFGATFFRASGKGLKMKPECLEILFQNNSFPEKWGLYMQSNTYHTTNFDFVLKHNSTTKEVLLVEVNMGVLRLNLLLGNPNNPGSFGLFRPNQIIFHELPDHKNIIDIEWDKAKSGDSVMRLSRVGTWSGNIPKHWPEWSKIKT